jgi:hypothetical protein
MLYHGMQDRFATRIFGSNICGGRAYYFWKKQGFISLVSCAHWQNHAGSAVTGIIQFYRFRPLNSRNTRLK